MATKQVMTGEDEDQASTGEKVELPEEDKKEPEQPELLEKEPQNNEDEDNINPDDLDQEDEEREAIRERRKQERQERKERRDEAIKRDKIELDFLRKQNDELERRVSAQEQRARQNDLSNLDAQLKDAINEMNMAEQVIAKAVSAGNGEDVTRAMKYRDQAIVRAQQLNQLKQQAEQVRAAPQPAVDDTVMQHARKFLQENAWYDHQGRDEDSAIVMAIDQGLAKDGYDPKTAEYWAELRRRAARRLPEKFKALSVESPVRESRGGPAVGSGKEHAPASTRQEIYLSPERKAAMIEAGVWDDPKLRARYAKRYAEYDRANRA